nr:hypothetical protein GCM10025732_59330 [Glycomyces mayteni]
MAPGVGGAELFELGGLVGLRGLGAAAQLVLEVAQEREAELAVVVDVDADEAHVREPGGVAAPGGEAREGDALFEVEEVQRELVGAVFGGEPGDPRVQEVGLAGAGGPADECVGRLSPRLSFATSPAGVSPIADWSPDAEEALQSRCGSRSTSRAGSFPARCFSATALAASVTVVDGGGGSSSIGAPGSAVAALAVRRGRSAARRCRRRR